MSLVFINVTHQSFCFISDAAAAGGASYKVGYQAIIFALLELVSSELKKYRNKFQALQIQPTKDYFKQLIKAYAYCNSWEKAKQVVFELESDDCAFEIKSELVSVLVRQGFVSDALGICDEVGENLTPRAAIHMTVALQNETKNDSEVQSELVSILAKRGHISEAIELCRKLKDSLSPRAAIHMTRFVEDDEMLDEMLGFLKHLEKSDESEWYEGCKNVILYCGRKKLMSGTMKLIKMSVL